MRIAIDYTPAFEQGGGIGRYVRDLVAALARLEDTNTYKLFVAGARAANHPRLPELGDRFSYTRSPLSAENWARLWQRARLPLLVETLVGAVDLYHATDFTLPPTRPATKTLLTVHDLSFVRVPEAASPRLKTYLDVVVPRSVRRADHILADSEATRQDLIALYNTPPNKITVLLSGVEPRFRRINDIEQLARVRAAYNLPQCPFMLAVGTVQPRKNYARLVHALALLRASHDVDLVIAGGRGWLEDGIYAAVQETGLKEHVHFIGFANDDDLPALYSLARVVAVPSIYEGFGLPVLEGMACGTPILTANVSSLPEVAGDAALMVDPTSTEAIADGLHRLLEDEALRGTMVERGLARAAFFTWERAAQQLLSTYTRIFREN